MPKFEVYKHHGYDVFVRSDLKGKHREHCLCYSCAYFRPDDREDNCTIANLVYYLCVALHVTLPVWECPVRDFAPKDQ